MLRSERSDFFQLVYSVRTVRRYVKEEPLLPTGTVVREMVRLMGGKRSVGVKCCFWGWEHLKSCGSTDLDAVHPFFAGR